MNKVLFGRKVSDLKELKELTIEAKQDRMKGTAYIVTKNIQLNDREFKSFTNNFFKDQPWITKEDGGNDDKGRLRCIRVTNTKTNEKILIDSEGYTYSRYTAIEE